MLKMSQYIKYFSEVKYMPTLNILNTNDLKTRATNSKGKKQWEIWLNGFIKNIYANSHIQAKP